MAKTVFIGQQPSNYEDEGITLPVRAGSSGDRIIRMMGITEQAFREHFDCINVSAHHEPDGFSPAYYIPTVRNIRPLLSGRRIVLLGPAVAEAFEIERTSYRWCEWFDHPKWETFHGLFTVIPHPSGANRLYNDAQMYETVRNHLDVIWQMRDRERATCA